MLTPGKYSGPQKDQNFNFLTCDLYVYGESIVHCNQYKCVNGCHFRPLFFGKRYI